MTDTGTIDTGTTNTETLKLTTPTDLELAMTRVFNAPRGRVFEALTTPEILKRWFYGPPIWSLAVCDMDLKVGGKYRWEWRGPNGMAMGVSGVFQEVEPPERLVQTEVWDESWYPGTALVTMALAEEGGQTILTLTVRYDSREARDSVLKTPMKKGVSMNYDRLAELLAA